MKATRLTFACRLDLDDFAGAYSVEKEKGKSYWLDRNADVSDIWKKHTKQPILLAVEYDMPDVIVKMVDAGADINTVDTQALEAIKKFEDDSSHSLHGSSLLDAVKAKISSIEDALVEELDLAKPITMEENQVYLAGKNPGSYEHWYLSKTVESAVNAVKDWEEFRTDKMLQDKDQQGKPEQKDALRALQKRFTHIENQLSQLVSHPTAYFTSSIVRPWGV